MSMSNWIILVGVLIVGIIFLLASQGIIFSWTNVTQEDIHKADAQELFALLQRAAHETTKTFYYCKYYNPVNITVKNGIFIFERTFEKNDYKFSYTVPKEISDVQLTDATRVCIVKQGSMIDINENASLLFCQPGNYCPGAPEAYTDPLGHVCCPDRLPMCSSKHCCPTDQPAWCGKPIEGDPRCMSVDDFKDPTKCIPLCSPQSVCSGAPSSGPGDNTWTDSEGKTCCPLTDSADSGPICSSNHCCPTSKPRWCNKPKTGSSRCMDQNEFQAEECEPTLSCSSINSASDLPSSWDWRNLNGVNWEPPIRNQGSCGSCWDFSAVGAVEGTYNIEQNLPGANTDLSEQAIVSCGSGGTCAGGWNDWALEFIKNTGVCDEACFPYQAADVPCTKCSDSASRTWKINSYVGLGSDFELKKALVCTGPLSVCMTWLPHCIGIVGYNDATGYWIIRNSWGTGWGQGGYNDHWVKYGELVSNYYVQGVRSP